MRLAIREAAPADASVFARIHISCWRTNFKGQIEQADLDTISESAWTERRERHLSDPARVKLAAEWGGKLIGFCDGGASRDSHFADCGELYALYVSPEAQGSGAGRALLLEMKARLKSLGYQRMMVKTLGTNPASRGFYEKLGGVLSGDSTFEFKGRRYPEVAYLYTLSGL